LYCQSPIAWKGHENIPLRHPIRRECPLIQRLLQALIFRYEYSIIQIATFQISTHETTAQSAQIKA